MRLRPYQNSAVDAIYSEWQDNDSTLLVLPTGCGKTICFAEVIRRLPSGKRAMVIAHREELIWQAAQKIEAVTKLPVEVEMAEFQADRGMFAHSPVVVATVQTLNAGAGDGRISKFDPNQFGALIVDEAHHVTASSYRYVVNHFRKNPECRVLGVTATPDRSDEEALGQMFDTVAFDYEISDAITDGWLVPIAQRQVFVEGIDLSSVRTTAGDLNEGDLARIMEFEQNLHEVAAPTFELAGKRKTLIFAASVAHAERLSEILNRHRPECAKWICGKTPKDERRKMFAAYARGDFQFLCNVGVLTEGFDDPGVEVVVMARPTKSRALYAQMVGRGTRALPGVVDRHDTAEERTAAIAVSAKPLCEVVDFVGNTGKHKLVSVADILGGNYSDDIVARAKREAKEGVSRNVLDDLKAAAEAARREAEEEQRRQAARRANIRAKANYSTNYSNPFDVFHIGNVVERGWDKGKQPSQKMLDLLDRQGIDTKGMNYTQIARLCKEVIGRFQSNQCSFKQARLLSRYGYPTNLSRKEASAIIDTLASNGWKDPNHKAELIKTY